MSHPQENGIAEPEHDHRKFRRAVTGIAAVATLVSGCSGGWQKAATAPQELSTIATAPQPIAHIPAEIDSSRKTEEYANKITATGMALANEAVSNICEIRSTLPLNSSNTRYPTERMAITRCDGGYSDITARRVSSGSSDIRVMSGGVELTFIGPLVDTETVGQLSKVSTSQISGMTVTIPGEKRTARIGVDGTVEVRENNTQTQGDLSRVDDILAQARELALPSGD
jgi:hypothetical protein